MERQEIPHDRLESFIGRRVCAEKAGTILRGELLAPLQDQNDSTRRNMWSMRTDEGTDIQILVKDYKFYVL
jgi:hypothetical protein